jgi:hypothetical protein
MATTQDRLGYDYGKNTSFVDLFDTLSDSIKHAIKVGSLARFKSVYREFDGYGIAEVTPFPLQQDESAYTVYAYFLTDYSFSENELVEIIYNDSDFRNMLTLENPQIKTSTKAVHSLMYGIIIPIMNESNKIKVDDALSETSTNPVQNKIITLALENKQDKLTAGTGVTIGNDNVISADVFAGGSVKISW